MWNIQRQHRSEIKITYKEPVMEPPFRHWYKVMHDRERYEFGVPDENKPDNWDWRIALPEVYNLQPEHATEMNEEIQNICFGLLRLGAPSLSLSDAKKKYRVVYRTDKAFCNHSGYPAKSGDPKKADYINETNIGAPLPQLDKVRICGGSLVTGVEVGNTLIVNTIDANNLPKLDFIIRNHMYFVAVSVGANSAVDFPQGGGEPVYIPLISRVPVEYPLNQLIKLELGYDISTHNPYQYSI